MGRVFSSKPNPRNPNPQPSALLSGGQWHLREESRGEEVGQGASAYVVLRCSFGAGLGSHEP